MQHRERWLIWMHTGREYTETCCWARNNILAVTLGRLVSTYKYEDAPNLRWPKADSPSPTLLTALIPQESATICHCVKGSTYRNHWPRFHYWINVYIHIWALMLFTAHQRSVLATCWATFLLFTFKSAMHDISLHDTSFPKLTALLLLDVVAVVVLIFINIGSSAVIISSPYSTPEGMAMWVSEWLPAVPVVIVSFCVLLLVFWVCVYCLVYFISHLYFQLQGFEWLSLSLFAGFILKSFLYESVLSSHFLSLLFYLRSDCLSSPRLVSPVSYQPPLCKLDHILLCQFLVLLMCLCPYVIRLFFLFFGLCLTFGF